MGKNNFQPYSMPLQLEESLISAAFMLFSWLYPFPPMNSITDWFRNTCSACGAISLTTGESFGVGSGNVLVSAPNAI